MQLLNCIYLCIIYVWHTYKQLCMWTRNSSVFLYFTRHTYKFVYNNAPAYVHIFTFSRIS